MDTMEIYGYADCISVGSGHVRRGVGFGGWYSDWEFVNFAERTDNFSHFVIVSVAKQSRKINHGVHRVHGGRHREDIFFFVILCVLRGFVVKNFLNAKDAKLAKFIRYFFIPNCHSPNL